MQSSSELRRENVYARRQALRGTPFKWHTLEDAAARLLRVRSSWAAQGQTLMVRSAMARRRTMLCIAENQEALEHDRRCVGCLKFESDDLRRAGVRQATAATMSHLRAAQCAVYGLAERFDLERLLQRGAVAIFFRKARGAVAGGEDEGAVAGLDQIGDR